MLVAFVVPSRNDEDFVRSFLTIGNSNLPWAPSLNATRVRCCQKQEELTFSDLGL